MPVSNYSFFHTLSQIYYKEHHPDLFNQIPPNQQRNLHAMKQITDKVFSAYHLFAFIIHDPEKHREFARNLKEEFLTYHHRTGKKMLFFSLTQPPELWKDEVVQPDYVKHLQQVFDESRNLALYLKPIQSHLFDQTFNVNAMAKILKIPIERLPAIIVTTHPSLPTYKWYQTSTKYIGKQLKELAILANDLNQFGNEPEELSALQEKMFELMTLEYDDELNLSEGKGNERLTESLATALSELLSFLINRENNYSDFNEMARLQKDIALTRVINAIGLTKSKLANNQNNQDFLDLLDDLCEKAGTFMTLVQSSTRQESEYKIPDVDEESNMLFTIGNSVDDFLKSYQNRYFDLDFTPAAICLAKAFEIEINKSIVHWIRKRNEIRLPNFYYKVQPEINVLITPNIKDGQPIDFNKSRSNGTWHPPALGQSYLVAAKNIDKNEWSSDWLPEERKLLFREWQKISNLRNLAAHSEKVSSDSIKEIMESIETLNSNKIFSKMARMKEEFRGFGARGI